MDSEQTQYVADLFNEMVGEYDNLNDLWYSYTFGTIDRVLCRHFLPRPGSETRPVALDLGCGTGIQSLRLAQLGYRVSGIDVATKLVAVAKEKLEREGFGDASFQIGNIEKLPFEDEVAEVVNCCGPVLSFVPDWRRALAEISRCLKPGGKLLLEVEGKWNFDLLWSIISGLTFNSLGYDESLAEALGHLLPPWRNGHTINYAFKNEAGQSVEMPLRLFAASELRRELANVHLCQERRWALHGITNLIPSTVLHKAEPGSALATVFRILAAAERRFYEVWPFNTFGCSLLVIATKDDHASVADDTRTTAAKIATNR